jgi:hypothetical protein
VQGRESLDEALHSVFIYGVAHGVESVDWHLWTRRLGVKRGDSEKGRSEVPLNKILDHFDWNCLKSDLWAPVLCPGSYLKKNFFSNRNERRRKPLGGYDLGKCPLV